MRWLGKLTSTSNHFYLRTFVLKVLLLQQTRCIYIMADSSSSSPTRTNTSSDPNPNSAHNSTPLPPWISATQGFFKNTGTFSQLPEVSTKKGFFSDLIRGLLKVVHIERGHLTCLLTVKPSVSNVYGSFHGGAVAVVAKLISIACARTVVAEDKDLFLGELSISYLSAAFINVELEVDGRIVRSGRNVAVTSIEFRIKETKKLVYTARATFYVTPFASL